MSKPSNWPVTEKAVRYIMPASTVAVLERHTLTTDLFPHAVGYYPTASGHIMKRPVHDDWLFLYCVAGKATISAERKEFQVAKGDLVFLPNGLPHAYWADDNDPWSIYWVHFLGKKAGQYADPVSRLGKGPVLSIGLRQKLVANFTELVDAAARNSANDLQQFVYAANLLKQIICYIACLKTSRKEAKEVPFNLEHVQALMAQEIEGNVSLDALASQCGMSRFYFAKKYRQLTGESPIAHFINMKMTRACRLLDMGGKSITEVAYALGYQDTYYFSRIFKKVTGLSPRQYKNVNKG